jgi:hypothetical protein
MGRSADWVQFILDRPMAHTPGDLFYYNTGNAYLRSAIIQKLSGGAPATMPTSSYSRRSGLRRHSLNLKALSLTLAGRDPGYYRLDVYTHDATNSSIRLDGPIGLDGFCRKGKPDAFGVRAARGSWLGQRTFAIDFNYAGLDEQHSWQLSFDGDRVTLRGKSRDGREIAVEGKRGE